MIASFLLICAFGCGAGSLAVYRMRSAPALLPGAQNVAVVSRGAGTLRITYRAAGGPFEWRSALAHKLIGEGWIGRSYTNMGATRPPFFTIWFTRRSRFGPINLVQRAVLGGDPNDPQAVIVDVSRELVVGGATVALP